MMETSSTQGEWQGPALFTPHTDLVRKLAGLSPTCSSSRWFCLHLCRVSVHLWEQLRCGSLTPGCCPVRLCVLQTATRCCRRPVWGYRQTLNLKHGRELFLSFPEQSPPASSGFEQEIFYRKAPVKKLSVGFKLISHIMKLDSSIVPPYLDRDLQHTSS